jgi:hypothetical protein
VFDFWRGPKIFSSPYRPDRLWGSTQPPIQWVPGAVSLGIKQKGREADRSRPPVVEVKNGGAILPLPHTSSRRVGYRGLFRVCVNVINIAYTVHRCTIQFAVLIHACTRVTVSMAGFSSTHCHLVLFDRIAIVCNMYCHLVSKQRK